ncbi:precorrin-3B synthase [Phyllobacterium sp. 21LDTY02-6]|uniref:precorrin-3B synthase n=1 Tax=Phyllobacterium sp. 21LDTY02-6 TaxID=2944903 RepID=UPI00202266F8|nr:precorrin-3B synthase [Phyllobacterium sp. 21LDTY02-6]MCO4317674.1 precorrin-3B synthase [Phyllobacterium sp. 21LDTY02-6]
MISASTIDRPRSSGDRRSACPGLFRMVEARDGGICRLKLTFGELTAQQARGIADAARRFGNGIIDITNRANLQLRGVAPEHRTALIDALLAAGLGPLTDEGDDVRNVMINPTAGFEPALIDARPLGLQLLAALQTRTDYQSLSPKFCILIDGGETVAKLDHPHDLWLSAADIAGSGPGFCFGFAGVPPIAADDRPASGFVMRSGAGHFIEAVLDLFLDWRADRPESLRMRHLLAEMPAETIVAKLRQGAGIEPAGNWRRAAPDRGGHLGRIHAAGDHHLVGALPALGRLSAASMQRLSALALSHGDGRIRMTPWQSVLIAATSPDIAAALIGELQAAGFTTDIRAPLANMIACSGSTGCGAALADTQADAAQLADRLAGVPGLPHVHLTGCAKSCASPLARQVTLVATSPGHYDIFLHATGGPSRFGKLLAGDRTIEEAAELIGARFSGSGGPFDA